MYKLTTGPEEDVHSFDTVPDAAAFDAIDAFIERVEAALGSAKRPQKRSSVAARPSRRRDASHDGSASREKIDLVLYTSPHSEKSQKALLAVRAVLDEYDRSQVKFTVCDLSKASDIEADGIIFTPTLVKRSPGPRTWIVGNLEHRDLLIDMLDVSGVDRRRE